MCFCKLFFKKLQRINYYKYNQFFVACIVLKRIMSSSNISWRCFFIPLRSGGVNSLAQQHFSFSPAVSILCLNFPYVLIWDVLLLKIFAYLVNKSFSFLLASVCITISPMTRLTASVLSFFIFSAVFIFFFQV